MNEFHKHRAASILACYNNVDEIIEKAIAVGTINKYGKQKQPDGSWKYVGKGKVSAPKTEEKPVSGQPLYTISKKPNSNEAFIKTPDGWELIKDFFDQHKEGIPANIAEQITFNSANVPDFMETAIKVAMKTIGATAPEEKSEESKSKGKPEESKSKKKKVTADQMMEKLQAGSFNAQDFEDLLSDPSNVKELDALGNKLHAVVAEKTPSYSSAASNLDEMFESMRNALRSSSSQLIPNRKSSADFSKCTFSQTRMINAYTQTAYKFINRHLGGSFEAEGIEMPKEALHFLNAAIETLNNGINNIENLNSTGDEVYRGFSTRRSGADQIMLEKAAQYMMNIGNSITPGTVMSTAYSHTSFGTEGKRILYKIDNTKGVGKLIEDISSFSTEREVLFPTTAKFKIKSVKGGDVSTSNSDFGHQHAKFFVEMESIG